MVILRAQPEESGGGWYKPVLDSSWSLSLSETDCFAALAMTDKRRAQSDNIITRLTS